MTYILNTIYYWAVGGSTSQVYFGGTNTYVPVTDPTYEEWLASGNLPLPVADEVTLWQYMSQPPASIPSWMFNGTTFSQPGAGQYTKDQLKAYAAQQRYAHTIGGVTVNGMPVVTDMNSQTAIVGAYNMAVNNSGFSTRWKAADGTFTTLNSAAIIALAVAVGTFIADCFAAEATIDAAIDAGTTTTLAQIDAAINAVTS
jgi:hypothetical protein